MAWMVKQDVAFPFWALTRSRSDAVTCLDGINESSPNGPPKLTAPRAPLTPERLHFDIRSSLPVPPVPQSACGRAG
jgi:hypothetical protein